MKHHLAFLLLFIFSHTLLWGQDTIRFEPLEFSDTVWSEQLEINNDWSSSDNKIFIVNAKDTSIVIYKKENNYWLRSNIQHYCSINCFEIDSAEHFMFLIDYFNHGANGNLSNEVYINIVDLNTFRISDQITIYSKYEGWDWTDTNAQIQVSYCMVTIYTEENKLFIKSLYIDEEEDSKAIDIDDDLCVPTGEYHYINGNFVKVKPYIHNHTFTHSVFDLSEETYLTPDCAFYFECDCCFDQLLFTSDSTFVVVSPCTEETSVSHGRYEVIDNMIHLHYSGIWKHRYMVLDEQGIETEYAIKTNMVPWYTRILSPELCKNTTLFSEQTKPEIKMLRSEETLESKLTYLKRIGLLD